MIAGSSSAKLIGYSLALGMPLLAPVGVRFEMPWLAPFVVFGLFPLLGLLIGEDRALPLAQLGRLRALIAYLEWLPRVYAFVWITVLVWAAGYAARGDIGAGDVAWLAVATGIGSAVAICTAHELVHRRSGADVLLGRTMSVFCFYGHMYIEHLHHHATMGDVAAGETAPRGSSIYRFALSDFRTGFGNAWTVETSRLRRLRAKWWRNRMLQDYGAALGLSAAFFMMGPNALILFVGQAVFAVFCFEVITYLHHYGLVRATDEEPGPEHAWAHHCWITNCLTFNNTFHSDHHLRPATPYYELHAMHGAPKLPASYFTMFCVALVPPLWRRIMDRRLDALHDRRSLRELPPDLLTQRCR